MKPKIVLPPGTRVVSELDGPQCDHCGLILAGADEDTFNVHHDRAHPECVDEEEVAPSRSPRTLYDHIGQIFDSVDGPLGRAQSHDYIH